MSGPSLILISDTKSRCFSVTTFYVTYCNRLHLFSLPYICLNFQYKTFHKRKAVKKDNHVVFFVKWFPTFVSLFVDISALLYNLILLFAMEFQLYNCNMLSLLLALIKWCYQFKKKVNQKRPNCWNLTCIAVCIVYSSWYELSNYARIFYIK